MFSTIASVVGPSTALQSLSAHTKFQNYTIPINHSGFGGAPLAGFELFNPTNDEANFTLGELVAGLELANATNSSTNSTNELEYPQIPAYIRTTSMVFCIIIMCLGVVGNVMVPIVIMKTKDMRNSTNIFLMNLSIADLMVLLVCTPTVLVEVNTRPETWVLGKEMCLAVPFVELTVAHASVLTILAISFERYYAICEPLKAGYVCTKTRAALICFLAWFFAAVFTSPILAVAEYKQVEYHDGSTVPVCLTLADEFWPTFYFLMTIFLFFLIPLLILLVLYAIIAKNLISTASKMVMNKHLDCNNFKARRQVVMMLGTVVFSFFVCLMPFKFLTLYIIIVPDETIFKLGVEKYYNILYFSRTMFYLNSAINPILYNLMSSKFRDGFLLVCCLKKKRQLKNYRRGYRDRAGTFNTTSTSCTTSSSMSIRSASLKHVLFKKSSTISSKFNDSPVVALPNLDAENDNKSVVIVNKPQFSRSISMLPNIFSCKQLAKSANNAENRKSLNYWKKYGRSEDDILEGYVFNSDRKDNSCIESDSKVSKEKRVIEKDGGRQHESFPFLNKRRYLDSSPSSLRKKFIVMSSNSTSIEEKDEKNNKNISQESYV